MPPILDIKKEIYRYLKKNGKSTISAIIKDLYGSPEEISEILDKEVERGYIRKDITTDPPRYSIRIKLGRLVKKEEIIPLWKYKDIIQRIEVPEKVTIIPQSLLKTLLEALFWWQGSRGTCVGFAAALYKWLLYMLSTGDIPTIEEIQAAGKIIEEEIGCTRGKFKYMTMPRGFFSPQWIYDRSRKFGGTLFPAGSDTTWAAKIIALEGTVTWDTCLTSITALCAPELWPMVNSDYNQTLAKFLPKAAEHQNKFAASNNYQEILKAIKDGKSVFGPVNLPPDYFKPNNDEWTVYGGDSAGGHACFWCLSDNENRIASRGSWDGDGGLKWYWIGERFFDENAGPFLIGLTQQETIIGASLYLKITVKAKDTGLQIPADVKVNSINIGLAPQRIVTEPGKSYEIEVSFMGYKSQKKVADDSSQEIIFELDANLEPIKNWFERFIDWLINLFKRF